jgi:hypothetical protein
MQGALSMENQGSAAGSEGLCSPLIAVLSSERADAIVGRNGLNFADLLAPFCAVDITIKVFKLFVLTCKLFAK